MRRRTILLEDEIITDQFSTISPDDIHAFIDVKVGVEASFGRQKDWFSETVESCSEEAHTFQWPFLNLQSNQLHHVSWHR